MEGSLYIGEGGGKQLGRVRSPCMPPLPTPETWQLAAYNEGLGRGSTTLLLATVAPLVLPAKDSGDNNEGPRVLMRLNQMGHKCSMHHPHRVEAFRPPYGISWQPLAIFNKFWRP
jgi:hypothetical protein